MRTSPEALPTPSLPSVADSVKSASAARSPTQHAASSEDVCTGGEYPTDFEECSGTVSGWRKPEAVPLPHAASPPSRCSGAGLESPSPDLGAADYSLDFEEESNFEGSAAPTGALEVPRLDLPSGRSSADAISLPTDEEMDGGRWSQTTYLDQG